MPWLKVLTLASIPVTLAALSSAAFAANKPLANNDPIALEALRNFATCAVDRSPEGAEELLTLAVDSSEYHAKLRRYAKGHDYCAPGARLQFSGLPFAGDLAEALIALRFDQAALDNAPSAAEPADQTMMESVGICIVRQRPAAIKLMLGSKPGSDAELAALKQTADLLQGCIPKGQTMQLNRPAVRAMYALGAYRQMAGPFVPATDAADGKEG